LPNSSFNTPQNFSALSNSFIPFVVIADKRTESLSGGKPPLLLFIHVAMYIHHSINKIKVQHSKKNHIRFECGFGAEDNFF
jgi:hypothetical protein